MCYPLPKKLIRKFAEGVKNVIVVEELDPFMEEQIRAMGIDARGKSIIPICGELLPEDIAECCRKAGILISLELPFRNPVGTADPIAPNDFIS